jgi:hypothetical protein
MMLLLMYSFHQLLRFQLKLSKKHKAALQSYARSVLAAVAAVVATGNWNPEDILKAVVIAVLPPVLRWVNPNDKAFGRIKKSR